jgi:Uncharacterised nucleotidyltransferase
MGAETEAASISQAQQPIELLSKVMFRGYCGTFDKPARDLDSIQPELEKIAALEDDERAKFVELANTHHVIVRTLSLLERASIDGRWYQEVLSTERTRTAHALEYLQVICQALESHGCKVAVIKSLDHWPDLGSDLDLYTTADEQIVEAVMWHKFHATPAQRSWGDRLAHKWNFRVPGLPELIEIHVRYLGQTGEHNKMAHRVTERRVAKQIGGRTFYLPAPEERIVISSLQRMYRHFYFRLCDMADVAALLQTNQLDFAELRKAADIGCIWPGVATFLFLVAEYARSYGANVQLSEAVLEGAYSPHIRVHFEDGFLRVPKLPAAGLYGAQLLTAGRKRDLRAICRLPLLPPLAVSAMLAMHLTGSDKGVW